jgi:vacuolar-type H+-ATPase subunit I/STV1
VATLLAARRPRNPIGWLLFGVLFVGANPSGQYDVWAYRIHPGTAPFGWVAVVILAVAGLLLGGAESLSGVVRVARHDVRITATGDLVGSAGPVFVFLAYAVVVLSLIAWLAWLAVQVPTYRRADGERRQQLKWLYSGAAITLVAFIFGAFVIPLALGDSFGSPANPVINALFVLSFGALPLFMGVAVLRYRLYELDRIISRVVSYALVTALLVGVYTGLVLAATHLLPHKSAVAVAVSTLITAALFAPCGGGCSGWWTGGSTGPGTTPKRWWPRSLGGCGTPSTSTPSGTT